MEDISNTTSIVRFLGSSSRRADDDEGRNERRATIDGARPVRGGWASGRTPAATVTCDRSH
jgi:hypothetical protein